MSVIRNHHADSSTLSTETVKRQHSKMQPIDRAGLALHTHTHLCRRVADCWYYFSVSEVYLTCPKPRLHILTGSILLYTLQPERTGISSGGRRFMKLLSPRVNPRHLLPRGFLLKTITSRPAGLQDAPLCHWRDLFVLVIAAVCSR